MWSAVIHELATNIVALLGVVVPAIAVLVAVFGHLYNNWTARTNLEKTVRFTRLQLELSFYERIKVQQVISKGLYKKLKHGKAAEWRLLNSIAAVQANEGEHKLAKAIVDVNEKIVALVAEKGELVRRDVNFAETVEPFLLHFQIISSAIRDAPFITVSDGDYYPRDFDTHVTCAISKINEELEKLFPAKQQRRKTSEQHQKPVQATAALVADTGAVRVEGGGSNSADPAQAQKTGGSNG